MEKFTREIYELLRKVPRGRVTTYKILANALGTRAYRAVGTAMKKNPNAPETPCHRVVCNDGRIGGYAFGIKEKIRILSNENVRVVDGRIENFENLLFRFNQ